MGDNPRASWLNLLASSPLIVPGVKTSATAILPAESANFANLTAGNGLAGAGLMVFDGANWARQRAPSAANFPTAQTLTARNSIGAAIVERGSRWSVTSNPGAGTIASATIAGESGVRHVVDSIAFSAAAVTAPALSALLVVLRDGATATGNILWQYEIGVPALTGQVVAPHSLSGLNLPGTTGLAMTFEFNVGLTNLIECVSISGYNVA